MDPLANSKYMFRNYFNRATEYISSLDDSFNCNVQFVNVYKHKSIIGLKLFSLIDVKKQSLSRFRDLKEFPKKIKHVIFFV